MEHDEVRTKLAFQRLIIAMAPVGVNEVVRANLTDAVLEMARSLGYGIQDGRVL